MHCCKYAARGSADRAEVWCRAEVKQAARGSADRAEVWRRAETHCYVKNKHPLQ